MKALFISSDRRLCDVTSDVYRRHVKYAEKIGELHVVVCGSKRNFHQEKGLTVHTVQSNKVLAPFMLSNMARKLIREVGIDVVSAQDPFEYGLSAVWAIRNTKAKLHIQVHTDFLNHWYTHGQSFRAPSVSVPFLNHLRQHIADFVLPKAIAIRVVSKRVSESLTQRYGNQIVEPCIIPIPVPKEVYSAISLPEHPFTFVLIAVSRLAPEKRIQDVLVAISVVRKRYPSVGLFLVGEGPEKERLLSLVRKLGIEKNVVFLGAKSYVETRGLMLSAQCFIQASAYEGYGMSLVEAALSRLPIITTDVGIVGEVFQGYDDVLAVPVGDPAALVTHIVGLIEDQQKRISLVINAEQKAVQHLQSTENLADQIAEHLKSALV